MAYRIERDEHLGAGARRIVAEQLHNAVDQLEGRGHADREAAVHEARKSLKKSRSVIRLLRYDIPRRVREEENAALGDAGRRLSGVRDAEVMLRTLAKVESQTEAPASAIAAVRELLERHRDDLVAQAHDSEGAASEAARALRDAERRVPTWPVDARARRALREGIARIYSGGQDAMAHAFAPDAPDEAWHDWRKRVKDLWYALRILEPTSPRFLSGMVEEASELSDILGEHNDLAVLAVAIDSHWERIGSENALALLTAVLELRDALRVAAKAPGARLYADSTKGFVRRIRVYWKARES